jgi:hypothetical protein
MEDDLSVKKKNTLGLIPGEERFVSFDKDRRFNIPQSVDQFQSTLDRNAALSTFIDPKIPDLYPRQQYISRLKDAKSRLEKERGDKIKQAAKLIEDEYFYKINPIDHAIKKLECIIFLKEKCDMVILENGKVK